MADSAAQPSPRRWLPWALATLLLGCGGGGPQPTDVAEAGYDVNVSPSQLIVPQGLSATLRVDLRGLQKPDTATGYAYDLDKAAARMEVSLAPCPSGVGTIACQDWTITPSTETPPGRYVVLVRANGTRYAPTDDKETTARFELIVTRLELPQGAAFVASEGDDALVVTSDGRLYGSGRNQRAQIEFGYAFTPLPNDLGDSRSALVQPVDVFGFVRAQRAVGDRWRLAAVAHESRMAVRDSDGSLWAWGDNHPATRPLGFPPGQPVEFSARRVDAVSGVTDLSFGGFGALVVSGAAGNVSAIGGANSLPRPPGSNSVLLPLYGATTVPARLAAGNANTVVPLTGVRSVGGTASIDGRGLGVAARFDGSVVVWGARPYLGATVAEGVIYDPAGMPQTVPDLANIIQVQAAPTPGADAGDIVALSAGGEVFELRSSAELTPSDSTQPQRQLVLSASTKVAGAADVVELSLVSDAGVSRVFARRRDGSVLSWRHGQTEPRPVAGLSGVIRLGGNHAISGECVGAAGTLWRLKANQNDVVSVTPVGLFGFRAPNCDQPTEQASIRVTVTGPGRVRSAVPLIDCGNLCANTLPIGAPLALYALPDIGYQARWVAGAACPLGPLPGGGWGVIGAPGLQCDVVFDPRPAARLDVVITGSGSVSSSPGGIDCGARCSAEFEVSGGITPLIPTRVILSAAGAPGWRLAEWSGACAPAGVVTLIQALPKSCQVRFERIPENAVVTVTHAGTGSGTVTSLPAGIDCGSNCSSVFAFESLVRLQAQAAAGSRFVTWLGDADCRDALAIADKAKTCIAQFDLISPPGTPFGLQASVVSGTVELRWQTVGSVDSYELLRRPGTNGAASRIVVFAAPAESYVDSAVGADTTYSYELVARNGGGSSAAATVSARTLVNSDWTRIGASDIDARPGFAQPSLAISPDGNGVGIAQVISGGAFEQTQVFRTDTFAQNNWARLAGTPGGALLPAANGTQPALALDSQGAALVAWTQAGAAGNDVRVARYDTASAQWLQLGGAIDLDLGSPALNDATLPAIAIDSADQPVVGWLQGGSVYVRSWNGSAWEPVGGSGSVNGPGFAVDAFRLVLDAAGTPHVLVRRGAGSAARLFAFRASGSSWEALGGALNAPLAGFRDSLGFFDLVLEADNAALAVWSEGSLSHDVLAARWRGGAWQALPKIVDFETGYAITGLAAARSAQAATINPAPPLVMLTRSPVFTGSNPNNGYGLVYFLQNEAWQARPPLLTRGPMFGLTLRVTRQATPVAAWLAETGAVGSGELQLFVWRGAF